MSRVAKSGWEHKRTDETRLVEELLGKHFEQVDSYRYNSAVIRVRVVDAMFEGKSREKRGAIVEKLISKLPRQTQNDIVTLLTFAPSELTAENSASSEQMLNVEFEDPSPSTL